MATITLYELSSYNHAYLLPFTIELDGLSHDEYLEAIKKNLERLKNRVLAGLEGDDIKKDLEDGYLNFEEWIVADTEDIPDLFVGTYDIDKRFFDFLESDIEPEVYEAYINCFGIPDDINKIGDLFIGHFNEKIDFINDYYLENTEDLENIKLGEVDALFYIDKEKLANDILINLYSESDNYYFMQR